MTTRVNSQRLRLEKKFLEQQILLKVSQSIVETLDYQEVLQIISDGMAELLNIETAAIYILEDNQNLFLGATTPSLPENMPDHLRTANLQDHPNIQKVVNTQKPVVIRNTKKAKLSDAEQIVVEVRNLKSLLFLPFLQKDMVIGSLILGTTSETHQYSDYEINLGLTVANQLSVGIINAKLHAHIAENNKRLEKEVQERLRTELLLKQSEAHLSNSLKIAKLGHWEYSVKDDLFLFTDEFYELLHTSIDEIGSYDMSPNQYAEKFIPPEIQFIVKKELQNALASDDHNYFNQFEHKIIYADGNHGYISVMLKIAKDEKGDTVKIYGVNQDVTDRKIKDEKLLEALEKSEESDRLKTAFLANLSHELRTPMNSIIGFSTLLKQSNLDKKTQDSYLERIENGSNRLLRLITDIVYISKIDAKLFTLNKEDFLFNKMLEDVKDNFSIKISNDRVTIQTESALPENESWIHADSDRLYQVYSNLLENALKFTEQGVIRVGYVIKDEEALLFVADSGIGIPKEYHEKIFERFWQAKPENQKINSGTGLGLSIVKSIIESMEGKIWIESELGKGSTFFFTIPSLFKKD